MSLRWTVSLVAGLVWFAAAGSGSLQAAETWSQIADRIEERLHKAAQVYENGDPAQARDLVNEAYFNHYEKAGLERAVLSSISSRRAQMTEHQFGLLKKAMREGTSPGAVRKGLAELIALLREDAVFLDRRAPDPAASFFSSFFLLLREGVEAILVLAAIVTYLTRSGNGSRTRVVYGSAFVAILASVGTAVLMRTVFDFSGSAKEILEGLTMLAAVVILFFVSHWIWGKAESRAWQNYIEGKVRDSLSSGKAWGLAAAAFLAVYREGAETVFFYQALFTESQTAASLVWLGFAVAAVALAAVFLLVRYGSVRLPLKPFFLGTSLLMYLLAIVFAGGGMKELQEADLVGVTPVSGLQAVDLLGLYPTWETLGPQIFLVALGIMGILFYRRKKIKT